MTAIAVIAVFLLLVFLASRTNSPGTDSTRNHCADDVSTGSIIPEQSAPPLSGPSIQLWEKNHFINKHLHRNDKKHTRHKENQYPW